MEKTLQARLKSLLVMSLIAIILVIGTGFALNQEHSRLNSKPIQTISGSLLKVTAEDMLNDASVIVKGSFTGESSAFEIRSVSGEESVYTDYYFNPQTVLRGDIIVNSSIPIRVRGGEAADYIVVDETVPAFEPDQQYLLFLQPPGMGGGYNTLGNYYYIMGVSQGVFTEQSDGVFSSEFGEEINLAAMPMAILQSEPDSALILNEYLDALQMNLESGFLTQSEYDVLVDQADEYATIIE